VRALVLTPTRELAAQVHQSAEDYGTHLPLRSAVVFGGVKINPQIARCAAAATSWWPPRGGCSTCQQGAVTCQAARVLVLDEADRMLDMGFIHDIRRIVACCPNGART
jgi:ATP-dependent RNA helicase RhlE